MSTLRAGKKVSDACKEDLAKYKIDRASNVNKNLPLGTLPSCTLHFLSVQLLSCTTYTCIHSVCMQKGRA